MAKTQADLFKFIRAHEGSTTNVEVAQKLGMTENSVTARASKLRNPEYQKEDKVDANGKTVYRIAVVGDDEVTETIDKSLAKKNKQGKLQVIEVYSVGTDGPKADRVMIRKAIPLKHFAKAGSARNQYDDAMALLAELRSGEATEATEEATEEVAETVES